MAFIHRRNEATSFPGTLFFPEEERSWKRGWERGCTLYHCATNLLEFFVCHSFKHFPRDAMTCEVWSVVLGLCFGKYVRNNTIALLWNDKIERSSFIQILKNWTVFTVKTVQFFKISQSEERYFIDDSMCTISSETKFQDILANRSTVNFVDLI